MFDKNNDLFPIKKTTAFLAHCAVSPLYGDAADRIKARIDAHRSQGMAAFADYESLLREVHETAAGLLKTSPENLAFMKNTSEALSMIAGGYPFEPGDRIVSYVHEYPANHYPWRNLENRGILLDLLPNRGPDGALCAEQPVMWTIKDLEKRLTNRTRMVALSHVQFTSGFAADLEVVGALCRNRGVDLVIDAAQSLGSLPVYPDAWGVSALASSGWKWLLGPVGTGLFFTTPEFRGKLANVLVGAEFMQQGTDYLDHTWNPHAGARRFEYSTSPVMLAEGLSTVLSDLFLRYSPEAIRAENFRLQDRLLERLDPGLYTALRFSPENRSGILAVRPRHSPEHIARELGRKGAMITVRGGYLRLAPHFYNSDEEIDHVASLLNEAGAAPSPG